MTILLHRSALNEYRLQNVPFLRLLLDAGKVKFLRKAQDLASCPTMAVAAVARLNEWLNRISQRRRPELQKVSKRARKLRYNYIVHFTYIYRYQHYQQYRKQFANKSVYIKHQCNMAW